MVAILFIFIYTLCLGQVLKFYRLHCVFRRLTTLTLNLYATYSFSMTMQTSVPNESLRKRVDYTFSVMGFSISAFIILTLV